MDDVLTHDYKTTNEHLIFVASATAQAKIFALIVNLPEALDKTIEQIEKNKFTQSKIKESQESGSLVGAGKGSE